MSNEGEVLDVRPAARDRSPLENTPRDAVHAFKLSFSGGAQAALGTPTQCGTYTSSSDFTPWSSTVCPGPFPRGELPDHRGPEGALARRARCRSPVADRGRDDRPGRWIHRLLAVLAAGRRPAAHRKAPVQGRRPGLAGMISRSRSATNRRQPRAHARRPRTSGTRSSTPAPARTRW